MKKWAHIGAGDYNKNHIKATDAFLKKYGGKVLKTKGRPIRLATPDRCKPYYSGKVVGVGESLEQFMLYLEKELFHRCNV